MKVFYFILFIISLSAQAQQRPNDSCAVGIDFGNDHYWYCESGILKSVGKSESYSKVEMKKWNELKEGLKADGQTSRLYQKSSVPNDSCATGFYFGTHHYLKCDGGLFLNEGKGYHPVASKEWNAKLEQLPGPQNESELDECIKMGNVIECPDGVYKKDPSVSGSRAIKEIQNRKNKMNNSGHFTLGE